MNRVFIKLHSTGEWMYDSPHPTMRLALVERNPQFDAYKERAPRVYVSAWAGEDGAQYGNVYWRFKELDGGKIRVIRLAVYGGQEDPEILDDVDEHVWSSEALKPMQQLGDEQADALVYQWQRQMLKTSSVDLRLLERIYIPDEVVVDEFYDLGFDD